MTEEKHDREGELQRYIVGVDLGTTNSALAYIDTEEGDGQVQRLRIPQLIAPGTVETRATLPSFHYQPAASEGDPESFELPWHLEGTTAPDHAVGYWAQKRGAEVPGRLVGSAKSWLSHSGVDRTAPLLPWQGAEDVTMYSPTDISARYLGHLRAAWDHQHPSHPLASQSLVLTVPASFDEIARELTVEAARRASLPKVVLIEEPQAAFYAWMDEQSRERETLSNDTLEPGEIILICDIGGGTTDFTLIAVRADDAGEKRFHRIAVGEHLILGGDNLDLTLAHRLEEKLIAEGGRIDPRQWSVLVRRCQQAKETLLSDDPPESLTITVSAAGSKLIGGARQVELRRDQAHTWLVEGFLPRVDLGERPQARRSGFREFGLPYAADAAITRYLAAFLTAHGNKATATRPDSVLFNGGFFASTALRERLIEVLGSWFSPEHGGRWQPKILTPPRLDFAVAHGAARYGRVRRGQGERIRAGLAHTYYISVAAHGEAPEPQAVCLVPQGLEEGEEVALPERRFELLIRQPVEFAIFTSSSRTTDQPGDLIPIDPTQLSALPPIRTVLRSGKKSTAQSLEVELHARLTEIGTLELWCKEAAGNRRWRLQFDVRSTVQTDLTAHGGAGEQAGFVEEEAVERCVELIRNAFNNRQARPDQLMRQLQETTDLPRDAWPPSLLRALWQALIDHQDGRRISIAHEARWLNLLGFALRPGSGYALDDWRVAQTWRLFHGNVAHQRNEMCRAEWWVLWRRIAGGLSAGQQLALADRLLPSMRKRYEGSAKGGGKKRKGQKGPHELAEMWRLAGALESLDPTIKRWLGETALTEMEKHGPRTTSSAPLWALGRLGSRVPAYGQLNTVLDAETAMAWLERLIAMEPPGRDHSFAVMQCARRTGDRFRDLEPEARQRAINWLEGQKAPAHWVELVRDVGELEDSERGMVFGDQLPRGLVLRSG